MCLCGLTVRLHGPFTAHSYIDNEFSGAMVTFLAIRGYRQIIIPAVKHMV